MRFAPSLRVVDRASTLLCAVAIAALVAMAASHVVAHEWLVERSGSMRPALRAGDLLGTTHTPATAIRTGDVVTYADAARGGRLITHRVIAIARDGGRVIFSTKGDANTGAERFAVPAASTVQRVSSRTPRLGGVLLAMDRMPWWALPIGAVTVVAAPSALRARRRR